MDCSLKRDARPNSLFSGKVGCEECVASKLDNAIATVAIAVASGDRSAMMAANAQAADGIKSKELAKLPDQWFPAVSAK